MVTASEDPNFPWRIEEGLGAVYAERYAQLTSLDDTTLTNGLIVTWSRAAAYQIDSYYPVVRYINKGAVETQINLKLTTYGGGNWPPIGEPKYNVEEYSKPAVAKWKWDGENWRPCRYVRGDGEWLL